MTTKTFDLTFTRADDRGDAGYPIFLVETKFGTLEVQPLGGGRMHICTGYTDEPGRPKRTIRVNRVEYDGSMTLSDGTDEDSRDQWTGKLPEDQGVWRIRYPNCYFGVTRSDWATNPNAHYQEISDAARRTLRELGEAIAIGLEDFFPYVHELAEEARLRYEAQKALRTRDEAREALEAAEQALEIADAAAAAQNEIVARFERAAEEGLV